MIFWLNLRHHVRNKLILTVLIARAKMATAGYIVTMITIKGIFINILRFIPCHTVHCIITKCEQNSESFPKYL